MATPPIDPQLAALIRKLCNRVDVLEAELKGMVEASNNNLQDMIEAIPGRRVFFTMVGNQTFTTTQDGARGNAITFEISQDGPWIMTHYPFVLWRSSLPTNATDFGMWRPINTGYLPTQELGTNFIDISYEMQDSGSNRNFQNLATPPLLSTPNWLMPLPVPTLFKPQSVISFIPTYENILFEGSTATTQGTLAVALPGYKIVNL